MNMQKEISLKLFGIVTVVLIIIEIFLLIIISSNQSENYSSEYCKEAVCNEDASICYAYDLDQEGNTVVVWRGSCQTGN